MFAGRANHLYQIYEKYDKLEDIPSDVRTKVEKQYFKKTFDEVWQETRKFYIDMLHDPERVEKAEKSDPKLKIALVTISTYVILEHHEFFGHSIRV
jgi:trans-AT polyketide synthase, acyltransferase and oxidoreductase domains